MSDRKISNFSVLTGSGVDVDNDYVEILDASAAVADRNKRIAVAELIARTSSFAQSGTGAVSRTVQAKLRDSASIFDFMTVAQISDAQSGAQSLDLTTAIQAAIDGTTGLLIVPPNVSCKITAALSVNKALKIMGSGRTSLIQQANASAANVFTLTGDYATLFNLRLVGNGVTGAANISNVVYNTANDTTVEECWLENGALCGYQSAGSTSRAHVRFNKISGTNTNGAQQNSADIYFNAGSHTDSEVLGNECLSTGKATGIFFQPTDGDTVTRPNIVNNLVSGAVLVSGVGGHGIILYCLSGTANIVQPKIHGNRAVNCENIGYYFRGVSTGKITDASLIGNWAINCVTVGTSGTLEDGAFAYVFAPRITMLGNYVINGGAGSSSGGLRINDGCSNLKCEAFRVYNFSGRAIYQKGSGSNNSNDLTFSHADIDQNSLAGTQGIWLDGNTDNPKVLHCHVKGVVNTAINLDGTGGTINDALVQGNTTEGAATGLNLEANAIRPVLVDNHDIGSTTPIRDAGATSPYRRNNRISTGKRQGRSALTSGTVTVNTAEVQTGDNIILTRDVAAGTAMGILKVGAIVNATSFVITACKPADGTTETNDTSTIYWEIVH